ncbi:MAG: Multidrug resistance protein MdtE [Burkholderia gladioli]|nr:MAG: Multidrug resistance protein MdtE [Burkholderia gladioli]
MDLLKFEWVKRAAGVRKPTSQNGIFPPLAPPQGGEVLASGRARGPGGARLCLARALKRARRFLRIKGSLRRASPAFDPEKSTHSKFKRGFVIDPRPYQAEVDRTAAQLAAAQARDGYAQTDWQRAQRLIGDNAIAKRDYDEKQNAARESTANVKAAAAALEAAKINLGYTRIVAPFSGRASRAEITLGNVVSAGASAAPLTTVVSVSPIYASFDADEQTYLRYISAASATAAACRWIWAWPTKPAIRAPA